MKKLTPIIINDDSQNKKICVYVNNDLIENGSVKFSEISFKVLKPENVSITYGGKLPKSKIDTLVVDFK